MSADSTEIAVSSHEIEVANNATLRTRLKDMRLVRKVPSEKGMKYEVTPLGLQYIADYEQIERDSHDFSNHTKPPTSPFVEREAIDLLRSIEGENGFNAYLPREGVSILILPLLSLKTVLIGDNSFIGVSHLSQERARERIERLDVKSIVEIIETAVSCRATGYTFSTHPVNLQIVKALKGSGKIVDGFGLYPVLPYAQAYVRLANEKGMRGLVDETLSKLSLSDKAKALFKSGLSALRLDPLGMRKRRKESLAL